MSWAEAALALAPLCEYLKPGDLLRPFLLMWVFKKLNLSLIQFCFSVICLEALSNLDW